MVVHNQHPNCFPISVFPFIPVTLLLLLLLSSLNRYYFFSKPTTHRYLFQLLSLLTILSFQRLCCTLLTATFLDPLSFQLQTPSPPHFSYRGRVTETEADPDRNPDGFQFVCDVLSDVVSDIRDSHAALHLALQEAWQ